MEINTDISSEKMLQLLKIDQPNKIIHEIHKIYQDELGKKYNYISISITGETDIKYHNIPKIKLTKFAHTIVYPIKNYNKMINLFKDHF